jgi:hypothetical protein
MKRVTHNPVSALKSLLGACELDRIGYFVTDIAGESSICVYPTSDDRFAAEQALQIAGAIDPIVQAALIGLVYVHNRRFDRQTAAAAQAFLAACCDGRAPGGEGP